MARTRRKQPFLGRPHHPFRTRSCSITPMQGRPRRRKLVGADGLVSASRFEELRNTDAELSSTYDTIEQRQPLPNNRPEAADFGVDSFMYVLGTLYDTHTMKHWLLQFAGHKGLLLDGVPVEADAGGNLTLEGRPLDLWPWQCLQLDKVLHRKRVTYVSAGRNSIELRVRFKTNQRGYTYVQLDIPRKVWLKTVVPVALNEFPQAELDDCSKSIILSHFTLIHCFGKKPDNRHCIATHWFCDHTPSLNRGKGRGPATAVCCNALHCAWGTLSTNKLECLCHARTRPGDNVACRTYLAGVATLVSAPPAASLLHPSERATLPA